MNEWGGSNITAAGLCSELTKLEPQGYFEQLTYLAAMLAVVINVEQADRFVNDNAFEVLTLNMSEEDVAGFLLDGERLLEPSLRETLLMMKVSALLIELYRQPDVFPQRFEESLRMITNGLIR
jgi:hypothetical protein